MSISQQSSTANKWLILLLVIGLVNVFTSIIPSFFFAIVIIVVQFVTQKKEDWSFLFVIYGTVFGSFFAQYGIRGIGIILILLGVVILLPQLSGQGAKLTKPILYVLMVLFLLLLSILITIGGHYATSKYWFTVLHSFLYLVAFGHLILFPEKHDGVSLSLCILVYSAFMFSYLTNMLGGLSLFDMFKFGSFRNDLIVIRNESENIFLYNYQQIAFYACIGLSFYFFHNKRKIDMLGWLIFIGCGLITLGCQSRQGLVTYVILVLFFAINLNRFKTSNIFVIAIILLIVYFWINSLEESTFMFVTGQNELASSSARSKIRQAAWMDFLSNPIIGIGYGRFKFEGIYGVNVHNIVFELLSELGIVGFSIFVWLSFNSFRKVQFNVFKNDYKWLFAIILVYILHLMVSSDMSEGICLFVIIFLIPVINQHKQRVITA